MWLMLSGGEFFLRRDWERILEIARDLRFAVNLETNATLIDGYVANAMERNPRLSVHVSFYGSSPEIHDAVTGVPGSLKRTILGVQRLTERGVKVRSSICVTRMNRRDLKDILEMCMELGAPPTVDMGIRAGLDGARRALQLRLGLAEMEDVYRECAEMGAKAVGLSEGCVEHAVAGERFCGAGRTVLAVNADGQVWPCVAFPRPIGDLRQCSLKEMIMGSAFLEKLRNVRVVDAPVCGKCDTRASCPRCLGDAFSRTGDLLACLPDMCEVATAARRVGAKLVEKSPESPKEKQHRKALTRKGGGLV
jgi:radical SAM protein with 4Fe4S-binding SPASM domain